MAPPGRGPQLRVAEPDLIEYPPLSVRFAHTRAVKTAMSPRARTGLLAVLLVLIDHIGCRGFFNQVSLRVNSAGPRDKNEIIGQYAIH
jgi:hypothetical protein